MKRIKFLLFAILLVAVFLVGAGFNHYASNEDPGTGGHSVKLADPGTGGHTPTSYKGDEPLSDPGTGGHTP